MAKYVCEELYNNSVCLKWVEYQTSYDMLAITGEQANQIMLATITVIFGAWGIRQVLNILLQRRY